MKKTFLYFLALIYVMALNPFPSYSQSILQRAKQKIKQRTDSKVDKTIDDGLDKAEGKKKVKEDKSDDMASGSQLTYTSKYDFVPGEKVIAFEDFTSAAIGDFPTRWNTNATAEVVTISDTENKWLKIGEKGVFYPEFITNLPENFTLEFDVGVNNANYFSPLSLNIANLKKPEEFVEYAYLVSLTPQHAVHLEFKAANTIYPGVSNLVTGKSGTSSINNSVEYQVWDINKNKF